MDDPEKRSRSFLDLRSDIIEEGLCTRCGGCVAACPVKALRYGPRGIELAGECISCGICSTICPGSGIDLRAHSDRIGTGPKGSGLRLLGSYKSRENLQASDKEVFRAGYMGGRVSAVLISAIERGDIDAALLTDWGRSGSLSVGSASVARTRGDVLKMASSKYLFSPVLTLLPEIAEDPSIERAALVGLPCHIHAIRKMEADERTKHLTEKISYVIGLNCGAPIMDEEGWRLIVSELTGADPTAIASFRARKRSSTVMEFDLRMDDGTRLQKDISLTRYLSRISASRVWGRCYMCPDYSAELSDVTFGSPVIRTEKGEHLINAAVMDGSLKKGSFKRALYQKAIDLVVSLRKRLRTRRYTKRRKRKGKTAPAYRR